MNIQLIQGQFNAKDAIDIVTQMIHVNINFHENKITGNCTEEDIKHRETKIKNLQKELFQLRNYMDKERKILKIEATINVS